MSGLRRPPAVPGTACVPIHPGLPGNNTPAEKGSCGGSASSTASSPRPRIPDREKILRGRPGAVWSEEAEEKPVKRNIFAAPPPRDALQMWEDPDFAIENIYPNSEEKEKPKTERIDPEVRQAIRDLTDGEPAMPEDYTEEERQAVAGFDSATFT